MSAIHEQIAILETALQRIRDGDFSDLNHLSTLLEKIRQQAGFEPGTPLSIRIVDGVVEIEVAPARVKHQEDGGVTVLVPEDERESVLKASVVAETLDRVRGGGR